MGVRWKMVETRRENLRENWSKDKENGERSAKEVPKRTRRKRGRRAEGRK